MKKVYLIIILISLYLQVDGQTKSETITGRVSFITSQNYYVKFISTEGILSGDTLYQPSDNNLIPVLVVRNLSSTSCVCSIIADISLPIDHIIIAKKRVTVIQPEEKAQVEKNPDELPEVAMEDLTKAIQTTEKKKYRISGSVAANSYSDFSGTGASNSQRFRYTFSFNARHTAESGLSFDTYISFKHNIDNLSDVKSDIFTALKIYSISACYDLKNSLLITLGRKINQRISNIGPIDGLQVEKSLGKFAVGAVTGFRPDYSDYGFNFSLFQFGGYASYDTRSEKGYTGTSVAFMEQMNTWKTDRRFVYIQHSNTILKNVSLLSSFEIDLYKLEDDVPKSTIDLTGAYVSLRYSVKRFTISGSYDARKNVMYYETYKTYLDRILETETRQGYRLDAGYRITNKLNLGIRSGYRFMKSDPHPSENIGAYISFSQIPGLKMSALASGTYIKSNYMEGLTTGFNLSGDYLNGKLQAAVGYHFSDFKLPESSVKIIQNTGEVSLSVLPVTNLFLSAIYEGTVENKDLYNRLYLQIRFRF